ncbi:hypothetical protein [Metabacillus fastidiosus]|uniref:hypothetical protein n=1 Tax=Metabacillus fastidiosus TaxID=1458 RepID=UPI003D2B9405
MAISVADYKYAKSWASESKRLEIRVFLKKVEGEVSTFALMESIEHLDGMAYSLLRFLNARNTLI